jgi:hypothetical protein
MRTVKFALPFVVVLAFALSACNTVENRRSLYSPNKGSGPYTRTLEDGSWKKNKSIDEQYAEAQAEKKRKGHSAAPAPAEEPATPAS